jgi:hypothetical protein
MLVLYPHPNLRLPRLLHHLPLSLLHLLLHRNLHHFLNLRNLLHLPHPLRKKTKKT